MPGQAPDVGGEDGARRRPRIERAHREPGGGRGRRDAAVVLDEIELSREAALAEAAAERLEVLPESRRDVGVHDGGIGPLVLAILRGDGGGERDGDARQEPSGERSDGGLVVRIGIGMEQGDCQRVLHLGWIERPAHGPVGRDALADLHDLVARDERRVLVDEEVVDVVAELPLDLEHVAEPLGRHQEGPGPLPLDDEVGAERRAMHGLLHVGHGRPRPLEQRVEALQHALGGVAGRREVLADHDGARGHILEREVGEGAADVEAEPPRHYG